MKTDVSAREPKLHLLLHSSYTGTHLRTITGINRYESQGYEAIAQEEARDCGL